jgi:uncharacterized Zn finger protein
MTGNDRGRRYLTEGRLTVQLVRGQIVIAACRGDGAIYKVEHRPSKGGWKCSCAARGKCAHLVALMLVTAPRVESAP